MKSQLTHIFAVVVASVYAYLVSAQGQTLLSQYPKAHVIAFAVITVIALYYNPNAVKP